jgi:hypothetical protein
MAKTAQEVYESLPELVTFSDIQRHGGPRGTAMRRWLRDNVPSYLARSQRNTVLHKQRDRDLIMLLLGRVGSGQGGGLRVPNESDNEALRMDLQLFSKPPSAASVQGNARQESEQERLARIEAARQNKRASQ